MRKANKEQLLTQLREIKASMAFAVAVPAVVPATSAVVVVPTVPAPLKELQQQAEPLPQLESGHPISWLVAWALRFEQTTLHAFTARRVGTNQRY